MTTNENVTEFLNVDIDQMINEYINSNNPHVYILSPCYGGMCHVNYMITLMNTQSLFAKYKINLTVLFMQNESLIPRARNNLIAKAMNDPTMTHVMFIDSDITWTPFDIIKLLIGDRPIIGGIYPLKRYNWSKLLPSESNPNPIQSILDTRDASKFQNLFNDVDYIQHKLLDYNVNYLSNHIKIDNNKVCVKHVATGFMMITRNTIDVMFEHYKSTKYTDDVNALSVDENKYAYALFDCAVIDKHYYSEDWLFCHRWSEIGGSVWMDIGINLTHSGNEQYKGSVLTTLIN